MSYLLLSKGEKLAYQCWGKGNIKKVLCLHGWMDNSSTMHHLGPKLAQGGFETTAIDFLGHGLSDHAPLNSYNHFGHYAVHVKEVVDQIRSSNEKVHLIGHSMGGAVALMFAAAYPEIIDRLVMIESVGPMTHSPEHAANDIRKAIDSQIAFDISRPSRSYKLDDAVNARMMTAKNFPGDQYLTKEAASLLVQRGTKNVSDGLIQFTHDKRLTTPSFNYYVPSQVNAFFEALQSETLIVQADNGWPFSQTQYNINKHILERKKLLTHIKLPGSHHLHLDSDTTGAVSGAINSFFNHGRNNVFNTTGATNVNAIPSVKNTEDVISQEAVAHL